MAKGYFKWKYPTDTPTYNSWRAMRSRCIYDGNNTKNHKDKGITICEEWESYNTFYEDMGERPIDTTLDRIDGKGNYYRDNCRWATSREQNNNKDGLTNIEYEGEYFTIGEICYIMAVDETTRNRAYKRYNTYGATTVEELFLEGSLMSYRVEHRVNKCKVCSRVKSAKWRKDGKLCNTCYHRALRWSKETGEDINLSREHKIVEENDKQGILL